MNVITPEINHMMVEMTLRSMIQTPYDNVGVKTVHIPFVAAICKKCRKHHTKTEGCK